MQFTPIHQKEKKLNSLSNELENVNFGEKLTFLIQNNRFSAISANIYFFLKILTVSEPPQVRYVQFSSETAFCQRS